MASLSPSSHSPVTYRADESHFPADGKVHT